MGDRTVNKSERLLRIEALLLQYPDGLSQADIARKLGEKRYTINRDLSDLTERFAVYTTDDGRLAIDRDSYLTNVRFTMHEAMSVHLAARLMATRMDKHNPHAASALRKLGVSLERLAPFVSKHLGASADVMDNAAQRHDPVYVNVLETLTRAWSLGRKVELKHQMPDQRVFSYIFSPYFIEPYAVGQTSHVIGWREPPGAIRTFKLERIKVARILDEEYVIPDTFDPRELLQDAWGIWYTESEPVLVVLRFHPHIAHRVLETQWHHNQTVEQLPDGYVRWSTQIAEPREMLPWIRGWGSSVEILEPEELRQALVVEAQKLARLYNIGTVDPVPLYQRLWAKTDRKTEAIHPLICHMIDVAQVAWALWQNALTDSLRQQFADALGVDSNSAGRVIAFWAGLHDLGKATPAFQRKYPPAQSELAEAGLAFQKVYGREYFSHGAATAELLPDMLVAECGLPKHMARYVSRSIGGHHGAWPTPTTLQSLTTTQLGDESWNDVQHKLFLEFRTLMNPPAIERMPSVTVEQNALWALLSGFVSVADWIGSMEEYFSYIAPPIDLQKYALQSSAKAKQALQTLHWADWNPPDEPVSFTELFQVPSPRPMQSQVIELAKDLDKPALVIIEAPTGVGKTEAALYLADHWTRTQRQRGLYVAMPTMATSNQMFGRTQVVLGRRYQGNVAQLLLVHSQSRWADKSEPAKVRIVDKALDDMDSSVDVMTWFLPRKRCLLAPFAVGTVDQTLLSVLQTRHFFVRLFGLSHKTIIFDEVHAYDTYMSTLFQHLLRWLSALGTSVVILSATLPEKTRKELLAAYSGKPDIDDLPLAPYPSITWAMDGNIGVCPVEKTVSRSLSLSWIESSPTVIAERLATLLKDGGYAVVICNTVGRAQTVYETLQQAHIVDDEDLILFHARFPFSRRNEIEAEVLARFGKGGERQHQKAIVVATQVIEQSLDLDFDVMISDLAPVDLLLQRAGRLHRHDREYRPALLQSPSFYIAVSSLNADIPVFEGGDTYIYEAFVLLRSYQVLKAYTDLKLPEDTVNLIESVYGDALDNDALSPAMRQALEKAAGKLRENQQKDIFEARSRLIRSPEKSDLLKSSNEGLAEDSPGVHKTLQALTRLAPPSIPLVCLHSVNGQLSVTADGSGPYVDLESFPNSYLTRQLVGASVSTSHWGVINYYREMQPPAGWREHPLLKRYQVAIFEKGCCPLDDTKFTLYLSQSLGLQIVSGDI